MSTEHPGDAQAVIDAATRAAKAQQLDAEGRFFAVAIPADGNALVIDLEAEADAADYKHQPRHKVGTYQVHDADSLIAYLAKHCDSASEVWADVVGAKITGVLDAHFADEARNEKHRVVYGVEYTTAWKAWTAADGRLLDQHQFAELIEERAVDVVTPSGADMLEIAQTFKATIGVSVESSKRLSDGQRQFEYREQVDAKAGKAGRMEIPETFVLGLRPFEGADAFKVTARLRYRLADGVLRIGYKLDRPEDVIREAFLSVVQKVQAGVADLPIEAPVFLGSV
mgnify:CR=1 FL=1